MTIIEEITQIINVYNKKYSTLSIDELLNAKDRLVTFNFNLAEEVSDAKTSYNMGYFVRKISIAKQKNRLINQGDSAAAAESAALEGNEENLKQEITGESISFRLDLLLKQSNKVVDAISQRISYLKTEKHNAERMNNT